MAKQEYRFRMAEKAKKTEIEKQHPDFATEVKIFINESLPIHNKQEYVKFIQGVTGIISRHSAELAIPTPRYDDEMRLLEDDELNLVIPAWGGVAPQEVSKKKQIREKLLIIRQAKSPSGVLGMEHHTLKDEYLTVLEGYVILMGSQSDEWDQGRVTLTFAGPGDTCALHPGNRHGIIAITNSVIEEHANNTLKSDILPAFT